MVNLKSNVWNKIIENLKRNKKSVKLIFIIVLVLFFILLIVHFIKNYTPKNKNDKLISQIKSKNYGDKIEYKANGVDDWQIFYNDGTNVYIIAENCVLTENLPNSVGITSEVDKNKYSVYWKNYTYKQIVSALLDTNRWKLYASGIEDAKATGGPTLTQFIDSWNEKNHQKIYAWGNSNEGWFISSSNSESKKTSILELGNNKNKEVYLPNIQGTNENNVTLGYWIADYAGNEMLTSGGGKKDRRRKLMYAIVSGTSYELTMMTYDNFWYCGIRPLVCLPNDVIGSWDGKKWIINQE